MQSLITSLLVTMIFLYISLVTKILKKFRPLCIFLPNMSACRRDLHETKFMSSLIKDDDLLEKFNEIWEKVKNSIKKEIDNEPFCHEKYLKTKIISYNGKTNTSFHNNKMPNKGSQFICSCNFDQFCF